MFAVIFEVQPHKERFDDYLGIANALKPEIEKIDGFIDNERFASKRREGYILSLSTWRDEKAVIRWRTLAVHHRAQEKGRLEIFRDYHLRVGEIIADTNPPQGHSLREQRFDETEVGAAKAVTISELQAKNAKHDLGLEKAAPVGLLDHELFESIYNPDKLALLAAWTDASAARRWQPKPLAGGALRHRCVRIIRDYGMFERREAPQYYPPVAHRS